MTGDKYEYWSRIITEQKASGQTARAFCRERVIGVHSFYHWRIRLRTSEPAQFALLETVASSAPGCALELMLGNGERLRIGNGVDAATLQLVLHTVRR